jgi:hypothetical protein
MDSQHLSLGENAYWVFISFLYASIATDIAKGFYKVICDDLEREREWLLGSHLVLASFVLGTSWIAWTLAFQMRYIFSPRKVISWEALLVIIDFVILVIYFNFVAIVSRQRESAQHRDSPTPYHKHASYWVGVILLMYVMWDIFADVLIPRFGDSFVETASRSETYFWRHSWMSVLCACLAWLAFVRLKRIRLVHKWRVIAGDAALVCLILFFRALKQMCLDPKSTPDQHLPPLTIPAQLDHLSSLSVFALLSLLTFMGLVYYAGIPQSSVQMRQRDAAAAGGIHH